MDLKFIIDRNLFNLWLETLCEIYLESGDNRLQRVISSMQKMSQEQISPYDRAG